MIVGDHAASGQAGHHHGRAHEQWMNRRRQYEGDERRAHCDDEHNRAQTEHFRIVLHEFLAPCRPHRKAVEQQGDSRSRATGSHSTSTAKRYIASAISVSMERKYWLFVKRSDTLDISSATALSAAEAASVDACIADEVEDRVSVNAA